MTLRHRDRKVAQTSEPASRKMGENGMEEGPDLRWGRLLISQDSSTLSSPTVFPSEWEVGRASTCS
jgi:hypothetical protein